MLYNRLPLLASASQAALSLSGERTALPFIDVNAIHQPNFQTRTVNSMTGWQLPLAVTTKIRSDFSTKIVEPSAFDLIPPSQAFLICMTSMVAYHRKPFPIALRHPLEKKESNVVALGLPCVNCLARLQAWLLAKAVTITAQQKGTSPGRRDS